MAKVPIKYLPKRLTRKDAKKYSSELKKSRRDYKRGKYHTRKRVKSFKSKESPHITKAKKMYGLENITASNELAKKTGCSVKALEKIVKKGQGAYYSSGSRPNQTGHSWGRARLASAITGGKSAAVDYKILSEGCSPKSKALRLAKTARKKHGYGTRRVPKTKMKGGMGRPYCMGRPYGMGKRHYGMGRRPHYLAKKCRNAKDGISGCRRCCQGCQYCIDKCMGNK